MTHTFSSRHHKKICLLPACAIFILLLLPVASPAANEEDTYKSLETFSNVLNILEDNYVEKVDTKKLVDGAIKGMLNSLDPHSSYLKPEDFKELQVETKGSFTGIGIEVTIRDGILTVVSPIEGTPAFEKGLKAGDKILKIGDESTKDMNLMEAVKKLRGPKGTKVTISVFREGWTELQEFVIVRDVIPLQSVKAKMLDPDYAYARITNFEAKTSRELIEALKGLASKNNKIKGLILDLRNNPGGLLEQAVRVSDLFLRKGVIVSTKGRIAEQNNEYTAHPTGDFFDYPMIVLVNEGSASASEIVAGALQGNKRALILGAQTFGKGSVQTIIPMPDGAGLRLTTALYYTPNGTSIQAKGITPDIVVPSEVEEEKTPDEQEPKFIREQDLKHHISNGNMPGTEEPEKQGVEEEQPATPDKMMEEEKNDSQDEELRKDHQLYTALLLLKGLDVFSGLKE
ncbi:MAG: S41 family peptidase [Deltaproteobacteria bacterium]